MTPRIICAVLSPDWVSAYRQAVGAAIEADVGELVQHGETAIQNLAWPERRAACLRVADECATLSADRGLTGTWAMLGADPSGFRKTASAKNYWRIWRGLATAIHSAPELADYDPLCLAIEAWRFIERAGSDGDDDLISAAHRFGAYGRVDRPGLLKWVHAWATSEKP